MDSVAFFIMTDMIVSYYEFLYFYFICKFKTTFPQDSSKTLNCTEKSRVCLSPA